jgi:hypothetical protein
VSSAFREVRLRAPPLLRGHLDRTKDPRSISIYRNGVFARIDVAVAESPDYVVASAKSVLPSIAGEHACHQGKPQNISVLCVAKFRFLDPYHHRCGFA